jgi:hypothetical protein
VIALENGRCLRSDEGSYHDLTDAWSVPVATTRKVAR